MVSKRHSYERNSRLSISRHYLVLLTLRPCSLTPLSCISELLFQARGSVLTTIKYNLHSLGLIWTLSLEHCASPQLTLHLMKPHTAGGRKPSCANGQASVLSPASGLAPSLQLSPRSPGQGKVKLLQVKEKRDCSLLLAPLF